MGTNRLEAFSDGVIAIIITIMVLELKAPHDASVPALLALWPTFLAYVLSFVLVAIYWVNHHQLIHLVRRVDGATMWLNINLLFWLSLTPFAAAFLGDHAGVPLAAALYAVLQTLCAASFLLLRMAVARHHKDNPRHMTLHRAALLKNGIAIGMYAAAIPAAYLNIPLSLLLMAAPTSMYVRPSHRFDEPG